MSLESQLSYLLKKVFGKMSEKKHLPVDPQWLNHPSLFPELLTEEEKAAIADEAAKAEETITKAVKVKEKPSRRDLDTTGLPVITEDIYPEGTTDEDGNLLPEYVEIGSESVKRIERRPALNYIHEKKMHKVILRSEAGADEVHVIEPERPLAPVHKCMAGASVLTDIIISKFVYHLPFYRIINKYKEGESPLKIPSSTICGWYALTVAELKPLYDLIREKVMASEYVQIDESVIPVLDDEKHKSKQGYLWVVRDAIGGQVYFLFDKRGRSYDVAAAILNGYKGCVQSDGYEGYDQFEKAPDIKLLSCWVHARRKFVSALEYDNERASQAIAQIARLYKVESEADEAGLSAEQRAAKRQAEAYPVLVRMEKWLEDNFSQVLPKSPIGKAISYTYSLMDRLSRYVNDGRLQLDNNLIENAIRPLAIGRKNWLFCANEDSATRAAIVYTLIACCKIADVDTSQWMEDALRKLPYYKRDNKDLSELLPENWKNLR